MKNLSPINENKDVVTKEYVDPIKSQAAINRTTLGTQCKNLLKNNAVTKTVNGVTFTVNSDGSVTVNGTNTSSSTGANLEICGFKNYGDIKLTASLKSTDSNVYMSIFDKNWVGVGIICDNEVTWDNGNKERLVRLVVKPGATINNVTVYPMIRYADITDDTYEPYKENVNERLINNTSDIAVNKTTLGYQCKNLLKNTAVTQTVNGVTFTVNNDKSVSVYGTTTSQPTLVAITKAMTLKAQKKYCLTGAYSGSIQLSLRDASMSRVFAEDNGNGVEYTPNKDIKAIVLIRIGIIALDSPVTLYPMLRYADITDDTYEPYQPSVQEQTPYSISVPGKSTSAAISYSGVPTLICLTPNTADSTAGGLYMINSAGAVVKLIEKTDVVVATNTANNTFTITNNTTTVMDVCISRCWGR